MDSRHGVLERRQHIIDAIADARAKSGMTQQEVAEVLGTSRSDICRIESGSQNITLDMLIRLSGAMGRDVHVLIERSSPSLQPGEKRYSLRLFDQELLTFGLWVDVLEGLCARIYTVEDDMMHLLPLDLELTGPGLTQWLRNRTIPKNRTFVNEILRTLGLNIHDTMGIIDTCRGLSLNDSYWTPPLGFEGSYEEYNLYENEFSSILSLIAYTGRRSGNRPYSTSPELTTGGMLPKAWRTMDDGLYLYKGGTDGGANTGREPYSEYYAYQIASCMGIDAVEYDLEMWKGILASKCRIFTDRDVSYVPIGRILKDGGLKACLDYYSDIGDEALESLKSMIVFDAVIYNQDRHFGNFGILRDNSTGEIVGAAPVFDNGMSLFNMAMDEDYEHIEEYAEKISNPYDASYPDICREIMGPLQRKQLRNLIGFKFKRHEKYNLPEEHLRMIEEQIGRRVRSLLELPKE